MSPDRTPAGYRSYDERHVEILGFVARAKGFGLSLDAITELLSLLDEDRCAPLQDRLRDLVDTRIHDAQGRIAELVAFTAELQQVAVRLRAHTPDGSCDESCGCTADQDSVGTTSVALAEAAQLEKTSFACTLPPGRVGDRLVNWHATLAQATTREIIDGGVRVRFRSDVDTGALAALARAEQDCCSFFTFVLTIGADGVALDVTGSDDARPMIEALLLF